jgi:cold shock CspA family protein
VLGTVEFFNNIKGWGVIKSDGKSFFVHHSSIVDDKFFPPQGVQKFRTLKHGQKVIFEPKGETGKSMDAAVQVKLDKKA